MKRKNKSKRGRACQVAVEYMLLLAVLLLVLLAALSNEESPLREGISSYVDGLGESVANVIDSN